MSVDDRTAARDVLVPDSLERAAIGDAPALPPSGEATVASRVDDPETSDRHVAAQPANDDAAVQQFVNADTGGDDASADPANAGAIGSADAAPSNTPPPATDVADHILTSGGIFTPGPPPQMLAGIPAAGVLDPTSLTYHVYEDPFDRHGLWGSADAAAAPAIPAPTAVDDVVGAAMTPLAPTANLVIILDRSGSMATDPDGPGGFATRFDLAKSAIADLLAAYEAQGPVNALVVAFNSTSVSSGWMTGATATTDASTWIDTLTTGSGTNYASAIAMTMATYGVGMWIGTLLSGYVKDFYTVDKIPQWRNIWMVPAGIALIVLLFFVMLFKDKKTTIGK